MCLAVDVSDTKESAPDQDDQVPLKLHVTEEINACLDVYLVVSITIWLGCSLNCEIEDIDIENCNCAWGVLCVVHYHCTYA